MDTTHYQIMSTPVDPILLAANETKITYVSFIQDKEKIHRNAKKQKWNHSSNNILEKATSQLKEYFAGKRQQFRLPLELKGTSFQQKAWETLQEIPYGIFWSYQKQALHIGDSKYARAVGRANGRNPISIIVPCHRVIGKNGKLTGYGGGISNKKWLLELEQKHLMENKSYCKHK